MGCPRPTTAKRLYVCCHKELLGRADKAHTSTAIAVSVADRDEVRVVEVHAERVAATTVVRGRPVFTVGTAIEDRSPEASVRGRQEDCASLL